MGNQGRGGVNMYADVVKLREVKKGECFTLKNPSTVPDEEMPSKYVYV